jgi:hypothetical protein
MFKSVEGDVALIAIGGVYKVCPLYTLDGKLFAGLGGGFVRMYANGSTSKPKALIERVHTEEPLYTDRLGRLALGGGEGRSLVADSKLLLGKE